MFDINKNAGLGNAVEQADASVYVEVSVRVGPIEVGVGVGVEF